jgi:hypothetical protein
VITSVLHIRTDGDGYALSVSEGTEGEGEGTTVVAEGPTFQLPDFDGRAEDPLDLLESMLSSDRHVVGPPEVCTYLFRLLADHGLGEWLEAARTYDPEPRSVRLHVDDPRLRRIPWEMVIAPQSMWAPFVDLESSWTRGPAALAGLEPVEPPVRVLFVAGDYADVNQTNDPRLSADDELDAILRALCRRPAQFHVEYLVAPRQEEFDAVYAELQPHVLHVVAHGTKAYGTTVLSFREGRDGAWALDPGWVTNMLPTYPRLVVLNACRSALGSEAAWSFTDLFLDKGAGAVVTMQGDIPDKAGVAFTEAFYGEIATGKPIDAATCAGRRVVYKGSRRPEHWAIPTLTLRSTPESVLAIPEPRPVSPKMQYVVDEAVKCVDRASERRHVWTTATPGAEASPPRLIVVTGDAHTGKSAVVKGALPACHARGCDIAYVDFGPSGRLGWFAAVKRVHDNLLEWIPEQEDRIAHFADVAERSRTGVYRDDPGRPLLGFSDDLRFENEGDVGDHRKKVIFRALRTLIKECSQENRLLLVLDHLFTGLSDEALQDYFLPNLVEPILQDAESRAILVAVVSNGETQLLNSPNVVRGQVAVPAFEKRYFELLLREYLARRGPVGPLRVSQKNLVKQLAQVKETWSVKDLKRFGMAAVQAGEE